MGNILIINYEYPPIGGGAGTASYYTSKAILRKGFNVTVMTSHFKGLPYFEVVDGVQIYRVPTLRRKKGTSNLVEMAVFVISAILHTGKIIKASKPKGSIAFLSIPSGIVSLWIRIVYGIPYIVSLRGGDVPYFVPGKMHIIHFLIKPLTKYIWRHAYKVSANSVNLSLLGERIAPDLKIEIIPNGVDVDYFKPEIAGINKKSGLTALFVGRLNAQKGIDVLFKALGMLKDNLPNDFRLLLVGDGPEEYKLKDIANKLDITKCIEYAGWIDRDKLADVYRESDIFILPSRYEGMPNALAEAIASGLPVITTDIPGCTTLVKDGVNGFVVPFDAKGEPNLDKLINAILSIINNRDLRRLMGLRSREIAERFSWDVTAERFLASFGMD
jgi:glycosyltransferase involved in cell wall biosynthesis